MTNKKPVTSPEKTTGSMRYVKMWVMECLEGTIRFDFDPDERGVWYDLILLGGRMRRKGLIAAGSGVPYPRLYLSGILNIPLELLERTIEKCKSTERIKETKDGLLILNWHKYQPEYDRQKPYRDAKRIGSVIRGGVPCCPRCDQPTGYCSCEDMPWNKDKVKDDESC